MNRPSLPLLALVAILLISAVVVRAAFRSPMAIPTTTFVLPSSLSPRVTPKSTRHPYEIALERIVDAKRKQATVLELRSLGLSSLPPEIGQLGSLEYLDMYGNQLTSLPSEVGQLHLLRVLVLNDNALVSLPPVIGQLGDLQELDLAGNPLRHLPREIGQLSKLQTLDLRGLGLTGLPPEISQLTNLRVLRVDIGGLATGDLPLEITQLVSLQELYLRNTGLTSLPPGIGQLRNLQILDLSSNDLTSLPSEIGQLGLLQTLELTANPLVILPPEVGGLRNLRKLTLSQTELTGLPPEIGQLSSLKELSLEQTKLVSLPREIGQLDNLETLSLIFANLTSLPPEIGQLQNLKILYLYGNQLTSLPPEIGRLSRLSNLYLSQNGLLSVPSEIGQLSSLQSLDLRQNSLVSLPPEIGQLSALCYLNLDDNHLKNLPNELGKLTQLEMATVCGNHNPVGLSLKNNPLLSPPKEVVAQSTSAILDYLRIQALTSTPQPFATSTRAPSRTPSSTPAQPLTFVPSSTATQVPTIRKSPTLTPTPTDLPAIATAIAKGECIRSFPAFAYRNPPTPPHGWQPYLPLPPWKIEATLPVQPKLPYIRDDYEVIARTIAGQGEIWIAQLFYDDAPIMAIYRYASANWELISPHIEGTNLFVGHRLFVSHDGTIWGRTEWNPHQKDSRLAKVPVLSRFNERTRRFELASGVLEISLVVDPDYFNWTQIVLDQHDIFWIFAEKDGLYRYDPAAQTTNKQADLPGLQVSNTALALDGSIYFEKYKYGGETDSGSLKGTLFQFFPETGKVTSIKTPDTSSWPFAAGMLVDHTGRLWLGASGYRDMDGTWHLTTVHPEDWTFSLQYPPPYIMFESSDGILWYSRFQDNGGDGTAWFDPRTGEGCLFMQDFVVSIAEDSKHQLWLMADGNLYKRP